MRSIKTKLILSISLLIIFLLGLTAILLINEKEKELTHDIYTRARAFSELTASSVVDLYEQYLSKSAFVQFNKEMKDIFARNEDVSNIALISYGGDIIYNSREEKERQYMDLKREADSELSQRVKASNASYKLEQGRIVYFKKLDDGVYKAVDLNENIVSDISESEKILNIVLPYQGKYAVLYEISYSNLQERIANTTERIIYLTVFGILIGLFVGYLFSTGITRPLKLLTEKVMVIAKGDFKVKVDIKSRDEIGLLAGSVNHMAEELEKSTKAIVYKERMAKELELAAQIQRDILPKSIPKVAGIDIAAGLEPASEIGGDCYDFIQTQNDCLIGYVGDVTGHGVPSGLVVAVANALVYSFSDSKNLTEILLKTNKILKEKTSASMFLTMLMIKWDPASKILKYASAGHEQPILYKSKEKKVIMLEKGGMALGMAEDISKLVKEYELDFDKGDVLLLYTDGIPEAWKNEKDNYGVARLKRALGEFADLKSAEEIKNALIKDVKSFIGKAEQKDDITLVVIKRG